MQGTNTMLVQCNQEWQQNQPHISTVSAMVGALKRLSFKNTAERETTTHTQFELSLSQLWSVVSKSISVILVG
jgi:hypothetical protein